MKLDMLRIHKPKCKKKKLFISSVLRLLFKDLDKQTVYFDTTTKTTTMRHWSFSRLSTDFLSVIYFILFFLSEYTHKYLIDVMLEAKDCVKFMASFYFLIFYL